ncbi:MAG: sel1 repeat family protein [Schwartzia sp.]|nr:sel1 repeat family protein [Schwartzia sp. (in: firmicutes)]
MKMTKEDKYRMKTLEQCIEDGELEAMFTYAQLYVNEYPEEVTEEIAEKIVKCYETCMEAGNLTAALNLGALYYEGNFIERDFKKAIHLYELATESDDNETRVRAWCNLGYCYYYGRDISVYKREDGVFVVPITSLKP